MRAVGASCFWKGKGPVHPARTQAISTSGGVNGLLSYVLPLIGQPRRSLSEEAMGNPINLGTRAQAAGGNRRGRLTLDQGQDHLPATARMASGDPRLNICMGRRSRLLSSRQTTRTFVERPMRNSLRWCVGCHSVSAWSSSFFYISQNRERLFRPPPAAAASPTSSARSPHPGSGPRPCGTAGVR